MSVRGAVRTLVRRGAHPVEHRETWARRLDAVARALGRPSTYVPGAAPRDAALEHELARVVRLDSRDEVWLALAAVSGTLPFDVTVVEVSRRALLDGPAPLLRAIAEASTVESLRPELRIVEGTAVVDVHETAQTTLATGIQRVARETSRRWAAEHPVTMVAWTAGFGAMRELTAAEAARMGVPAPSTDPAGEPAIVVPWSATYLLPELAAGRDRNRRILALARHTASRTGVIGFDCIPVTSGDTTDVGVPDLFADHLATVRHVNRIATISAAAATEYRGWRTMLAAIGLPGPQINPVVLPAEVPDSTPGALEGAAARFVVAGMPLVLCVGTHEPRKNHLALLHAAEILWREGHRFSLTFVGGHSWSSGPFRRRLQELQAAGRPVESASGISDELLWAAYRLARCTVFASLNEGFGLPAAESLAVGTPVITSGYGSMAEIARDGGALTVDPREDASLLAALRTLLTDDSAHHALAEAARQRPTRTWDDYARDTWIALTSG